MGQSFLSQWYARVRFSPVGRVINIPRRIAYASSYYVPTLLRLLRWGFSSREDTNFTYDLSEDNVTYLCHTLAVVTGCNLAVARRYVDEAREDRDLARTVIERVGRTRFRWVSDDACRFGRRLGWYALVRLLKPRVVVETGVDKGLGSVLLCAALRRNAAEGSPGRYFGTDINPDAGWLLEPPYDAMGRILYGDSIESLRRLAEEIDLFIGDSDHSAGYERDEYRVVASKLARDAVVVSDNAHVTPMLAEFAAESGRAFLYFHEVPKDHWYPGGGIGIAYRPRAT